MPTICDHEADKWRYALMTAERRNIKPRIHMVRGRWVVRPVGLPIYSYSHDPWLLARAYCKMLNARRAT